MRHRQRHVHATIVGHVIDQMTALGWVNDPVNFATTPVTVLDYEPQQAGETPALNTVAVSIDHEGADEEYELGGLETVEYTVFIDVYAENEPIGIAISTDIKDSIKHAALSVLDFTQTPAAVTDSYMEFEHVIVETIPTATTTLDKRTWRSVKAMAVVYFTDDPADVDGGSSASPGTGVIDGGTP